MADAKETEVKKTLANCNSEEFLTQTYKIVDKAQELCKLTDASAFWKVFTSEKEEGETDEQHEKKIRKALVELIKRMLKDQPKKTAEFIGLVCFVDGKELEKTNGITLMLMFLTAITDPNVWGFFTCAGNLIARF